MPVTFVLSHHIYNDFKSFIPDPKTKTNLWSIKDYSENVFMAVESVRNLSETAELWGRLLKSCHFDFTRLLRRHQKRAVCWRATENELFVDAPPKTNRLLRHPRKRTVCWRDSENCLLYGGIELLPFPSLWRNKEISSCDCFDFAGMQRSFPKCYPQKYLMIRAHWRL